MAEETKLDGAETGGENGDQKPPLRVGGQYTKDLSFEIPGAPEIFMKAAPEQPKIDMKLDVQVDGLKEDVFEVCLNIKVECKTAEETAYIAELTYAGIFAINVPEEQKAPILFVECPRLLFPFARAILSDVTREGGFQPLVLGPVDFLSIYQQNAENIEIKKKS